jgi:hypothetical protein
LADEINIDTSSALSFVVEGSTVRHQLKARVAGKAMVMTATAEGEFRTILAASGGPLEQARGARLLARVRVVPDAPSARALRLTATRSLGWNDIVILGTGDALGSETMTADRRAVSAARSQGVNFRVILHPPELLRGV